MRGKVTGIATGLVSARITPAYAGKSLCDQLGVQVRRDHPRLCGEKQLTSLSGIQQIGSPPPMRGKGIVNELSRKLDRITPAYAGKRPCRPSFRQPTRDHPRLCGEKVTGKVYNVFPRGSPPPMRGKEWHIQGDVLPYRITPAYAGKRSSRFLSCKASRDHPRLCGEKC